MLGPKKCGEKSHKTSYKVYIEKYKLNAIETLIVLRSRKFFFVLKYLSIRPIHKFN
jgi:hypothetical protein